MRPCLICCSFKSRTISEWSRHVSRHEPFNSEIDEKYVRAKCRELSERVNKELGSATPRFQLSQKQNARKRTQDAAQIGSDRSGLQKPRLVYHATDSREKENLQEHTSFPSGFIAAQTYAIPNDVTNNLHTRLEYTEDIFPLMMQQPSCLQSIEYRSQKSDMNEDRSDCNVDLLLSSSQSANPRLQSPSRDTRNTPGRFDEDDILLDLPTQDISINELDIPPIYYAMNYPAPLPDLLEY